MGFCSKFSHKLWGFIQFFKKKTTKDWNKFTIFFVFETRKKRYKNAIFGPNCRFFEHFDTNKYIMEIAQKSRIKQKIMSELSLCAPLHVHMEFLSKGLLHPNQANLGK